MFACVLPVIFAIDTMTPSLAASPEGRLVQAEDARIAAVDAVTARQVPDPRVKSSVEAPLSPKRDRPEDPYARRPVCDGMFLTSEWQLSSKQKACDWVQNRVFSTSALAGTVWSAATTPIWDAAVGQRRPTDGFPKRFGTNFAQNAFKSTGAYLGAMIQDEDPRQVPPFLVLRGATAPHGFARRVWHALVVNAVAYRCAAGCSNADDIKPKFALSRVFGSMASGFSPELWTSDRSVRRGLRGSATAYGATFANSLFVEFKPELTAFAGRLFSIF